MYPIPEGEPMARPSPAEAAEALEAVRTEFCNVPDGDAIFAVLDTLERAIQLPELFGTAAAAEVLGTTPANMQRWRSLPAPLYDLPAGKFYEAEAIRELAARRAEGAAA